MALRTELELQWPPSAGQDWSQPLYGPFFFRFTEATVFQKSNKITQAKCSPLLGDEIIGIYLPYHNWKNKRIPFKEEVGHLITISTAKPIINPNIKPVPCPINWDWIRHSDSRIQNSLPEIVPCFLYFPPTPHSPTSLAPPPPVTRAESLIWFQVSKVLSFFWRTVKLSLTGILQWSMWT